MTPLALLANYRTVNLGNQALTSELQRLLAAIHDGPIVGLHRLPPAYEARLHRLYQANGWTSELACVMRSGSPPQRREISDAALREADYSLQCERFVGSLGSHRRRAMRRLMRNPVVRSLREHRSESAVRDRASLIASVGRVVYVPAGEINPHGLPVGRFFEAFIARASNVPVSLINFSIEEPTEVIVDLAKQLFPDIDRFVIRDLRSAEIAVDLGARAEAVAVVPDAVLLSEPATSEEGLEVGELHRELIGATAVTANSLYGSADQECWLELIRGLTSLGHRPVFLSSEAASDYAFFREVARKAGLAFPIGPQISDRRTYLAVLSRLRAVVTGRLHTAVMATVAGTPTLALEAGSHKVTGGLEAMGLGHACVRVGSPGWASTAAELADQAVPPTPLAIDAVRQRIRSSYRDVFSELGSPV